MNVKHQLLFAAAWLMAASAAQAQAPKLSSLLQRSPAATNAVGYIHTESLSKLVGDSEVASRMSERVDDIWFVSEIDIAELRPRWEAGYATLRRKYDKDDVVSALDGYVDDIGGREAIWTPSQSYLVPVSDSVLGFLRPANRPMLANWFKSHQRTSIPTFLNEKSKQSEKYLSLMLAVSLEDAFSQAALEHRLKQLDSLKSVTDSKRSELSGVLASIRGASLILGRKDLSQCILELSFGESAEALEPFANELFHEISVKNGSEIEELSVWKSKVDGTKLSFKGTLGQGALSSLLSIFSLSDRAERLASAVASDRKESAPSSGPSPTKTKEYFQDVRRIIERVRDNKAKTPGALAKWNNNRARKIDDLSIIGIDDEMVAYGSFVSASLRNDALAIQRINIRSGQVKADQSLNDGFYREGYYGSGYSGYNNSVDQQRVTGAKARGAAYSNYRQMLSSVDQRTADVKKSMERKYQIEF